MSEAKITERQENEPHMITLNVCPDSEAMIVHFHSGKFRARDLHIELVRIEAIVEFSSIVKPRYFFSLRIRSFDHESTNLQNLPPQKRKKRKERFVDGVTAMGGH